MKKKISAGMGKALKSLRFGWGSVGGVGLIALGLSAQAAIFDVDVSKYTLYTDPIHGGEIKLGGFSGLYPVPGDQSGTMFYTVTDRGPTQDFTVTNTTPTIPPKTTIVTHKVLPCTNLAPMIVKVQLLAGGTAQVLEVIPLKKAAPNGVEFITGFPNGVELAPEVMKDPSYNLLGTDPDGLDPEGITIDNHGFFWICEEYRPSIAMIAPDGTVLLRLVPKGCLAGTEEVPTYDILPAVLTNRVNNRGMEGITFAPNGCLYGIMQRPLANPTKKVSEASRNLRIVEVNLKSFLDGGPQPAVRQFIYRTELPDYPTNNAKIYASDIFALNPAIMLVPERKTDKLYAINLTPATDITPFETEDGKLITDPTKTIEQLEAADLARLGIRTVKKSAVVPSLIALHPELAKCEGVAVLGRTVVVTYDNDFNLGDFGGGPTRPGAIGLKSPNVYPALITTPLPEEIVFEE